MIELPSIRDPWTPGMGPLPGDGGRAVVAFSGGQDSTTCLFYAIKRYGFSNVEAVTFDYGQRHRIELDCAAVLAHKIGIPQRVIDVPAFRQLGDAALTNDRIDVAANARTQAITERPDLRSVNRHAAARGLPSTFVPGRNIVFLSLAAAYALPRGATTVVTGVCQQDRAGYPDCRREFLDALAYTIRLGMDEPEFTFDAPLLDRDKAATWQLAHYLGVLGVIVEDTHTCYEGDHVTRHAWGYGCGECGACEERARGWQQFVPL